MKKYLLIILGLFSAISVTSQSYPDVTGPSSYQVQLVPKNPSVAELGKFGAIPVDKYNGTANIDVPFHEIDFEGLKLPIGLKYNTSGIQVNQDASWVGLGWNLGSEPVITRDINGFDDIRNVNAANESIGWIYTPDFLPPVSPFDFIMSSADIQFLTTKYTTNIPQDTEPDVYSVSLPSGSFKFYLPKIIGAQQVLVGNVINEKNFKVTFDIINQTFEVTDQNGFLYSFTNKEYSTGFNTEEGPVTTEIYALQFIPYASMNQTKKLISSWKVSQITSPFGKHLNFSYQDGFSFSYPHYSETYNVFGNTQNEVNLVNITAPNSIIASVNAFHNLYLTNISGDFGSVTFNLLDRKDLFSKEAKSYLSGSVWNPGIIPNVNNAKRLESIQIKDSKNTTIKAVQFYYTYFNNDKEFYPDKETYIRLKLDSVSVSDKKYRFEYYQPNALPPKNSKSVDFWGFYNGVNNVVRIPSSNRFYNSSMQLNINGTIYYDYENFFKFTGANRKSNINFGKYGILNKIVYPTGGYTEFQYEGNSTTLESNVYSPILFTNGRLRSSGILSSSAYNFRYQYLKLANDPNYSLLDHNIGGVFSTNLTANNSLFTISGTSLNNGQNYNVQVNATLNCAVGCGQGINPAGPAVWIENVQTGQVYNIFNFDGQFINGVYSVNLSQTLNLPIGNYKYRYASWSVSSPFLVVATTTSSATVWQNSLPAQTVLEEFEVGGARIKKIINHNYDGSFINAKDYTYNEINALGATTSSGKLMDDLVYGFKGDNFYEYTPEEFSDTKIYLASDNKLRTHASAHGSHIGYSQVTEKELDELGTPNGSSSSKYINKPNINHVRFIGVTYENIGIGEFGGYEQRELSYGDVYILSIMPDFYDYINGSVLEETVFDTANNPKTKSLNQYTEFFVSSGAFPFYPVMFWARLGTQFPANYPYHKMTTSNIPNNKLLKLASTINMEYLNGIELSQNTDLFYEKPEHYQLTKQVGTNSKGEILTTKFYYPQDLLTEPFMSNLITQNRLLNKPIKTEAYKGDLANPLANLLNKQITKYNNTTSPNGLILPKEVFTQKGSDQTQEVQRIVYEQYDTNGNLQQYKEPGKISTSLIWGYQQTQPLAKVENATYAQVLSYVSNLQTLSDADNDRTIGALGNEGALRTALNNLRTALPNAMVTTYTYDPLIGVTSITDVKGETIYYHYDNSNRLEYVIDKDGKVLGKNEYHYKN